MGTFYVRFFLFDLITGAYYRGFDAINNEHVFTVEAEKAKLFHNRPDAESRQRRVERAIRRKLGIGATAERAAKKNEQIFDVNKGKH